MASITMTEELLVNCGQHIPLFSGFVMLGRAGVRMKIKSMLGVRSELDAELAVSHLSLTFIWCLGSLSEPVVIQFSFCCLSCLSITASDKDT